MSLCFNHLQNWQKIFLDKRNFLFVSLHRQQRQTQPRWFVAIKIFDFMKTQNTSANEVSKFNATQNANENANVKTQRVLETRDQWLVIFNHATSLTATFAVGKELPEDSRKGFAFGKVAEQPHSRSYAQSLFAGFVSHKANKFFVNIEGLQTIEERTKIALAILLRTKLGGSDAIRAKAILSKAEPKQVRSFAEAVLSLMGQQVPEKAQRKQVDANKEAVASKEAKKPKAKKSGKDVASKEAKPKTKAKKQTSAKA